jgi:heme/copper-type cytochrome/quinol oxidase subunit 1
MRRGPGILIGGGILMIIGVILVVISINSLSSLSVSMPTDISTKSLIQSALNFNQTAVKETARTVGISLGLAFSGMLVATILIVNGIIALIAGMVIFFIDRRHKKLNSVHQHAGSPIG